MTWQIRKPNVTLNVRPVREWDARRKDSSIPKAGISPEARAWLRKRREHECLRIIPPSPWSTSPNSSGSFLVTGRVNRRPTF
jgi:hypothetical protein